MGRDGAAHMQRLRQVADVLVVPGSWYARRPWHLQLMSGMSQSSQ